MGRRKDFKVAELRWATNWLILVKEELVEEFRWVEFDGDAQAFDTLMRLNQKENGGKLP